MALTHSPSIVRDGLVLHLDAANVKSYPGSGTVWTDLSGNGNDGTLVNGVGYSADNKGSMSFDGVDDYVLTNFTPTSDDNKTISVWVKFDYFNASYDYIVGMDYNNSVDGIVPLSIAYYNSNWVMRLRQQFGSLSTNGVAYTDIIISPSEWVNLTISSDGNSFSFFKNGIKGNVIVDGGVNNGKWFSVLSAPIIIGSSDWLANQLYDKSNSIISNVSIYNKQLSDSEIKQNFNALKNRYGI